jgi:hypothetical protein
MEVFRITLLGSAHVGKTTLATTVITKSLGHPSAKYLRTRRNEFFFSKLKGTGLQFQDTVGGKEPQPSMDEIRAIRDEERADFGGPGGGGGSTSVPTPGSLDEDESSMLLTKRDGNPLLSHLKTSGFIVMYDATQRDTLRHAAELIRAIAQVQPADDPAPIIVICNKRDLSGGGAVAMPPSSSSATTSPGPPRGTTTGGDALDDTRWWSNYQNVFYFQGSVIRNDFVLVHTTTSSTSTTSNSNYTGEFPRGTHFNADEVVGFLIQRMKKSRAYEMLMRQRQLQEEHAKPVGGGTTQSSDASSATTDDSGTQNLGFCARVCACCCASTTGKDTGKGPASTGGGSSPTSSKANKASEMKSG